MRYKEARRAKVADLDSMLHLLEGAGNNSVGKRRLAFCHPNHSRKMLEKYFETFPQAIFVSEEDDQIIGCSCAIRTSSKPILEPLAWADATGDGSALKHEENGDWLYVSRLAYTAGPGHAHVSREIGPLLVSLQELTVRLKLRGVAFPARFSGFRERSGTTEFQKLTIEEKGSLERSGQRPLGIAVQAGFEHEIALPNYLGEGKHFAMMVWRNE